MQMVHNNNTQSLSEHDVENYIYLGDWNNNCSSEVFRVMSAALNYRITIHNQHTNSTYTIHPDDNRAKGDGEYHAYYRDNHYSSVPSGGTRDKFPELVRFIIDRLQTEKRPMSTVFETSCAPGFLLMELDKHKIFKTIEGAYYRPSYPDKYEKNNIAALHSSMKKYKIQAYSEHVYEVGPLQNKFDLIIIDVGRMFNTEELTDEQIDFAFDNLVQGGSLVVKTFANPWHLYQKACHFEACCTYTTGAGTECYYILTGFHSQITQTLSYDIMYERYAQRRTVHKIPYSKSRLNKFVQEFCRGDAYRDFRVYFEAKYFKMLNEKSFQITAITGYASSGKTATTAKDNPNALWIAPTRKLNDEHREKYKVMSVSQHGAIEKSRHRDIIVIDEISQFPIEYLMMIHTLNPLAEIIVIGDVEQTPVTEIINIHPLQTVRDYGVRNNIRQVFAIPVDITNAINKKYGYKMQTMSTVPTGLSVFKEGDVDFNKIANTKIPVIAFNSLTVQELQRKGFNAHTITSFTGARDHTVVFYIDDQSVRSKLTSQRLS